MVLFCYWYSGPLYNMLVLFLQASREGECRWYIIKGSKVWLSTFVITGVCWLEFLFQNLLSNCPICFHNGRPYLMDLGSTNKTYLNVRNSSQFFSFDLLCHLYSIWNKYLLFFCALQENPIEPQRYYELFEKDTIKFGNSR